MPTAYCTVTDLTVNPETGTLHVLVDRKDNNGMMNLGKASTSLACRPSMFPSREITNSRSIFPLQPTGLPSPMSGREPRSSTSVVSPVPDSAEVDPDVVEPLPALAPVLSAAVVSVDPTGTVVIAGVLEKPDESAVGAWQAPRRSALLAAAAPSE